MLNGSKEYDDNDNEQHTDVDDAIIGWYARSACWVDRRSRKARHLRRKVSGLQIPVVLTLCLHNRGTVCIGHMDVAFML